MTRLDKLIEAIEQLSDALGPCYTEDEASITINLSHDRGMRLKSLIMEELSGLSNNFLSEHFVEKPFLDGSSYVYKLHLHGTDIKWKARVIRTVNNKKEYI